MPMKRRQKKGLDCAKMASSDGISVEWFVPRACLVFVVAKQNDEYGSRNRIIILLQGCFICITATTWDRLFFF